MIRALIVGLVLWLVASAPGQTFYDELVPGLTREDYQSITSRLDMTKEQGAAADRLYDGYAEEHAREAKVFKAAFDRLGKAQRFNKETNEWEFDPEVQHAFDLALEKYHAFRKKARERMIADIRTVLTEAQAAEKWPGVVRFVRRMLMHSVLFNSPVEWVRADIIRCVEGLKLPAETLAKVSPLLDEYELRVDKPLQRMESARAPGVDEEDARRIWREAAREVGLLNKRYLRVVAQELPPDDARRLTAAAKALAYWQLGMNDGRDIRDWLAAGVKLASFTPEQQRRADALLAEIDKEVEQFRKEATPDYDEAADKVDGMSQKDYDEAMNREGNPFMVLSLKWDTKFSDMWEGWIDRMKAILTEEQRKELWPPTGDPLNRKP